MRLIIIMLLAGMVLLAGCTGSDQPSQPGPQQPAGSGAQSTAGRIWANYADKEMDFSIQYPVEWDYALTDVADSANNTLSRNVFFKPFTADDIVLAINVRNGSFVTSKSVVDMVSDEIEALNNTAVNGTVLDRSSTTVDVFPAAELVYRDEENGVPFIARYVFINTGNHRYTLYSRIAENKTAMYQPLIEEAITTLRITR